MGSIITIYTFIAGINYQSITQFFKEDHSLFWITLTISVWLLYFSLKALYLFNKTAQRIDKLERTLSIKDLDIETKLSKQMTKVNFNINRRIDDLRDLHDKRLENLEK